MRLAKRSFRLVGCLLLMMAAACGKKNSEMGPKIDALVNVSEQEREQMMELYEKRMQLLLDWEKSVKGSSKKMPGGLRLSPQIHHPRNGWDLRSPEDRRQFDAFQTHITNSIETYQRREETRRHQPRDLERMEAEIRDKRRSYHQSAFEANELMEKHDQKRTRVPTFELEQREYDQKKKAASKN